MEWIEKDFEKMRFNPWANKSKKFMACYHEFKDHEEIFNINLGKLDLNLVIRYIAFVYDKGSPLPEKIDNMLQMKLEAAELSGFRKNAAGSFKSEVSEMMVGGNKAVNHMIIRFLSFFHDIDFMTIRMYKGKHFELMQKIQDTTDPKVLDSLIKTVANITGTIDTLKEKIFHPQDTKQLVEDLYEQANYTELELTPELIAEKIERGYPITNDPVYGEDYDFEKYSKKDL